MYKKYCKHILFLVLDMLAVPIIMMVMMMSGLILVVGCIVFMNKKNDKQQSINQQLKTVGGVTRDRPLSLSGLVAPFVPLYMKSALSSVGSGSTPLWAFLAFVEGYRDGKIIWTANGIRLPDVQQTVAALKRKGGGAILSFGGETASARGSKTFGELAGSITDAGKLADAYLRCADIAGGVEWLDFDVEGELVKNTQANNVVNARRAAALRLAQKKRPSLKISFTLPMELGGVTADARRFCTMNKAAGVKVHLVNLMSMYYGDAAAVKKIGNMASVAMKAAMASKAFIRNELGVPMGITVLAGQNPDKGFAHENFSTENARQLALAAKSSGFVSLLSFWPVPSADFAKYVKEFQAFAS